MQDPTLHWVQSISFLGLSLGIILGILFLVLPRRYAITPLLLVACFIPIGAKISIAGANFSMLRVLIIFGCVRIAFRKDFRRFKWGRVDSLLIAWSVVRVAAFVVLWQSTDALVNSLGYALDAIGTYFICRAYITGVADIKRLTRTVALILVPVALLMGAERLSGHNPFHILGGVPDAPTVREGVIRCQGAFGHPILAGTFGAVWLPLFVGLWWQGKSHRLIAIIGLLSSLLIIGLSGSSGPVVSYMAGILGLSMWKLRRHMRAVRWAILGGLVALHLIMKDPVWFIFAKMDVISGSTGWHRAYLIDRTLANFSDWWLAGAKNVWKWGVWAGDTTNQFVVEAVRGGLITLVLFVALIVVAFSYFGLSLKEARIESRKYQLFLWALSTTMFVHVVSFLGISYFDQNIVNWYFVLASATTVFQSGRSMHTPRDAGPGRVQETAFRESGIAGIDQDYLPPLRDRLVSHSGLLCSPRDRNGL
jgi:hypothetical protein